jgi:hypothetical protein
MSRPLIDTEKEMFNRGKHEGKFVDHVARIDLDYLYWLVDHSDADEDSIEYLSEYLEEHFDREI